jgi:hypothetical protein
MKMHGSQNRKAEKIREFLAFFELGQTATAGVNVAHTSLEEFPKAIAEKVGVNYNDLGTMNKEATCVPKYRHCLHLLGSLRTKSSSLQISVV